MSVASVKSDPTDLHTNSVPEEHISTVGRRTQEAVLITLVFDRSFATIGGYLQLGLGLTC